MMTKVKLKLKNNGIKAKALSDVSGISYTYTVQVLNGRRPSMEVALKLAEAFNALVEKEEIQAKDFNPKQ